MKDLRYRQVHLDFHTSEHIPSVGSGFDKKEFQEALKAAHADSITLFARCHHGWNYYDSKTGERHPSLDFDLLDAEIEACKEIGVATPIYLTAGIDMRYARLHPDCRVLYKPYEKEPDHLWGYPSLWYLMCYNSPYMDYIVAQVEEVMQRYNPEGVFLDISFPKVCFCEHCMKSYEERGIDINDKKALEDFADEVYLNYCKKVEAAVRKYNPETRIFHNMDKIVRGLRKYSDVQTHFEIESLPTGGWGYDHFPMTASYIRTLGRPFEGQTGKFHLAWGEFGGFKHPNALRYETALSLSQGARCNIGDQLHPTAKINMSTYSLIGKAYAEVEKKEQYAKGAVHIVDVAILSAQNFQDHPRGTCAPDVGASRILLEGKYLFNLIDRYEDFGKYKLLILPDEVRIDAELKEKLEAFLANGGKMLCSGMSGLKLDRDEFAFDFGAKYLCDNEFRPNYLIPEYEALNGKTAYVMYCNAFPAKNIKVTDGKVLAILEEPYFNRAEEHFCSHCHTPNKEGADHPAAVVKGNVAYIAWHIFEEYSFKGEYHVKELVLNIIKQLLPDSERSATVKGLPDRGILTFTKQAEESRYVTHLLFAHTSNRGSTVEIIEDIIPVYQISVSEKIPVSPKRVYLTEYVDGDMKETDLKYKYENGVLEAFVEKLDLHAMVVVDV